MKTCEEFPSCGGFLTVLYKFLIGEFRADKDVVARAPFVLSIKRSGGTTIVPGETELGGIDILARV